MNGEIFTLSTEDLGRLDSTEAVQALRELLWAEATALSIGKNLIDVLGSVTARMLHCKTRPRMFPYVAAAEILTDAAREAGSHGIELEGSASVEALYERSAAQAWLLSYVEGNLAPTSDEPALFCDAIWR